jgi:hypothetical protein
MCCVVGRAAVTARHSWQHQALQGSGGERIRLIRAGRSIREHWGALGSVGGRRGAEGSGGEWRGAEATRGVSLSEGL